MSEMLERVTDAIFGMTPDGDRDDVRCIARAAIEAMREPTAEMLALTQVMAGNELCDNCTPEVLRNVWQALIDVAK